MVTMDKTAMTVKPDPRVSRVCHITHDAKRIIYLQLLQDLLEPMVATEIQELTALLEKLAHLLVCLIYFFGLSPHALCWQGSKGVQGPAGSNGNNGADGESVCVALMELKSTISYFETGGERCYRKQWHGWGTRYAY
jgi:hypothetical protein